jgi:hypothetical protein
VILGIYPYGGWLPVWDKVFGRLRGRSWSHAFSGATYGNYWLDTENCKGTQIYIIQ